MKSCAWGISDWAIKISDLHLAECQQGQIEPRFFPKLLPKGVLSLRLLLFEQAVFYGIEREALEGWTPRSDFGGAGSSFGGRW